MNLAFTACQKFSKTQKVRPPEPVPTSAYDYAHLSPDYSHILIIPRLLIRLFWQSHHQMIVSPLLPQHRRSDNSCPLPTTIPLYSFFWLRTYHIHSLASPSRLKPTPPRYQFFPFIHHSFHVINSRQSYEKVVEVTGGCWECQWFTQFMGFIAAMSDFYHFL